VGILDFKFEEDKTGEGEVIHTVQLKDQNNQLFYDKLKFVYLEMPHFIKQEHELETRLDKWLYFIKHLEDFQNIPEIFKDEIFEKAFQQAEIAKFSEDERHDYEQSLKIYRDLKNVIDTAFDEGIIKVAKLMKLNNEPTEKIIKYTGLTKEQIDRF
jgi:predicted transposase/invertase (TIGR01784 family)